MPAILSHQVLTSSNLKFKYHSVAAAAAAMQNIPLDVTTGINGFLPGEGVYREVAANFLNHERFAGVPHTLAWKKWNIFERSRIYWLNKNGTTMYIHNNSKVSTWQDAVQHMWVKWKTGIRVWSYKLRDQQAIIFTKYLHKIVSKWFGKFSIQIFANFG